MAERASRQLVKPKAENLAPAPAPEEIGAENAESGMAAMQEPILNSEMSAEELLLQAQQQLASQNQELEGLRAQNSELLAEIEQLRARCVNLRVGLNRLATRIAKYEPNASA